MKDLFRQVFAKTSQFEYGEYYRDFVQKAPAWLLNSAATAHNDVGSFPGFTQLFATLQERSASCWNNPELYPHLFKILRARDLESNPEVHLRALECHLGLREISPQVFTHKYFRLHAPVPQTFELVDDSVRVVSDAIVACGPNFPVVYMPVPNLFDDVVGGTTTYNGSPIPIDSSQLRQVIRDAADVLHNYDEELYGGFTEAVGTLAITGDWNADNRSSYSTGSVYTGGIFTSLCADSPTLFVESLIHEYYHQRLWLWWNIEAPSDIPGRDVTITSPISKQERSVQIMMQAFLIYVSLTNYYHWAARIYESESGWRETRWRTLQTGSDALLAVLREVLVGRDDSLRFVNAVAESNIA
jgi:hypothetical protein